MNKYNIIQDMINTQYLFNNHYKDLKSVVKKMYKNKLLTQKEFRVFELRHGLADGKDHTFSEIMMVLNFSPIVVLKAYNNALQIITNNIRQRVAEATV